MQANEIFLCKITVLKTDACVYKFYLLHAAGRSKHLLLKVCLMNCILLGVIPTTLHLFLLSSVTAYVIADSIRDKKTE